MSFKTWMVVGLGSTVLGLACMATGCSDDDTTPSSSSGTSGTSGTSGGTSGTSGGTSGTSGGTSGATQSLYQRLGGNAGIKGAVDAIVVEELKNADIASYFAVVGKGGATGPSSPDQIKECLVAQLGNAAGGPETYPTTVSGGFTCRSMTASHAELGIPNGVFDNFVAIAAATLKTAGVADADIATIGGVLNGTKAQIVTDTARDGGPFLLDANGNN